VRRLDDFNRFLETISFSHAQVLNAASIARECMVSRNTVESYISILEELMVAFRVPVFTKQAKRATVSHAKFFFFDCGLFQSLRPKGPLDSGGNVLGPALEGMIAEHLRAWLDYSGLGMKLFYWRTRAGNEVDFVLYGNDGFIAIEVKNSRNVRPEDLRGIRSFAQDYPEASCKLLFSGKERLKINNIECIPICQFLNDLRPGWIFK
jgi:uncharacterized protein